MGKLGAALGLAMAACGGGDRDLDAPDVGVDAAPSRPIDARAADANGADARADAADARADAADAADAGPPLSTRFITDDDGRVLILRGINVDRGAKAGGVPQLDEADAARIAGAWGFNFVRLLMTWEAVMPRPGEIDTAYLDALATRVDLLWAHGVHVLLDMHQDVYARRFCCDGAPEWAIRDDGQPFAPQAQWFLNYFQPAVQRSFDNFWAGEAGAHGDLQARYAEAWQAVARRFGPHPGVVGYDLFNEPSPGSATDVGELLGRPNPRGTHPAFDRERLFPAYQRLIEAIRAVDADTWIFVEPRYGAPGNGLPSYHEALTDPRAGGPHLVYAPHLYSLAYERDARYDPARDRAVAAWEAARAEERERAPMPLVLGEWGFDWTFPGAELYGADILAMADRALAGFAYWSYSDGTWGLMDATGADRPSANVVVRPAPRAIAGEPTAFGYAPDTGVFHLTYRPWRDAGARDPATSIGLATARRYPTGFEVELTPGATQSYDAATEVLTVRPVPGAAPPAEISVTVRPSGPEGP